MNTEEINDTVTTRKSQRKRAVTNLKRRNYEVEINQTKRMRGLEYESTVKKDSVSIKISREGRIMGPACISNACKKSNVIKCNEMTDEQRQQCFNIFWKMTWLQRKTFIQTTVEKIPRFPDFPNEKAQIDVTVDQQKKSDSSLLTETTIATKTSSETITTTAATTSMNKNHTSNYSTDKPATATKRSTTQISSSTATYTGKAKELEDYDKLFVNTESSDNSEELNFGELISEGATLPEDISFASNPNILFDHDQNINELFDVELVEPDSLATTIEETTIIETDKIDDSELDETFSNLKRKKNTYIYYLKFNNRMQRVCKFTYLQTLNVGEKMVYSCLRDDDYNPNYMTIQPLDTSDKVVRFREENKMKREAVAQFLKLIPKQPSHYCRSTSDYKYLSDSFKSKAELYQHFLRYTKKYNLLACSETLFSEILNENKLKIYQLKKDACDVCSQYEIKVKTIKKNKSNCSITDQEKNQQIKHLRNVKEARAEMERDSKTTDNSTFVFSADCQAMLSCPKLYNSSSYYKTKLSVRNLTFYNMKSGEVLNNVFDETVGGLVASVFSSIYYQTLLDLINTTPNIKKIILWSDTCVYQNRNAVLGNVLLHLAMKCKIVIIQKYLISGHSQMRVDSVHSNIEKVIRNRRVYVPKQYVELMCHAREELTKEKQNYSIRRKQVTSLSRTTSTDDNGSVITTTTAIFRKTEKVNEPKYYLVNHITDPLFFKDFTCLNYFNSLRPSAQPELKVNDLRAIKYGSDGKVSYKTEFGNEWQYLKGENYAALFNDRELESLYTKKLKISKKNFKHLQDLLPYIPAKHHDFYHNLPHH